MALRTPSCEQVPSVFRTRAALEADGFCRFVTLIVLIGSLVKDVDRPGVERVGWRAGGATNDANAI